MIRIIVFWLVAMIVWDLLYIGSMRGQQDFNVTLKEVGISWMVVFAGCLAGAACYGLHKITEYWLNCWIMGG